MCRDISSYRTPVVTHALRTMTSAEIYSSYQTPVVTHALRTMTSAEIYSSYQTPVVTHALRTMTSAEGAVVMPTTTVPTATKPKQRQEFKLVTGLQEGALLTQLQEYYKNVMKPVAPRVTISESTAGVIQHFYIGLNEGGPKALKITKEIAQQCTGLKDGL